MYNLRPRTRRLQHVSYVPTRTTRRLLRLRLNPYHCFIHILDNDSLLNIFFLCRPILVNEEGANDEDISRGGGGHHELWWYKLAHVCHRWQNLILASSSYLGLRLFCTYGTPITDMLAHSPPLPLIIDYADTDREVTAEDDKGILLALQTRDRICRIRLWRPVAILQELITAIDDEFPLLEYLDIRPLTRHDTSMTLPKTLQAPHLNHLVLHNFAFPIGSPLLMTATTLGTLTLSSIPSDVLPLSVLVQRLSLIPQLETLKIGFHSPIPDRDIERQLSPSMTHVTLPSLRWFKFKGTSAYLEALLPWITTPLLEKLQIVFFNQLVFSLSHLLQFMWIIENLRFRRAAVMFSSYGVSIGAWVREGTTVYPFHMHVICDHLDWQLGCASQIFRAFGTLFSAVVGLTLEYEGHRIASELCQDEDYTEWRELLSSFNNLKTLRMDDEFVQLLTRSRQLEGGNSLRELVPELRGLPSIGFKDPGPGGPLVTPFAGCLVTVVLSQPITRCPLQRLHHMFPLSESRFKNALPRYAAATGIKASEHDLAIEGRAINLWALHKAVFLRNGHESVTTNDEWPLNVV